MLFVLELERPSFNALDALLETFAEVTFFAINSSFLFLIATCFKLLLYT